MSTQQFINDVNRQTRQHILDNFQTCRAVDLCLDSRAGHYSDIYVSEYFIAVEGDGHMLDYYGGFEYVDGECIFEVGDYKFYSARDQRVRDHIEQFFEREEDEEEIE